MENQYCLNCNHKISEKFCSNCGQKTDTHRLHFNHFVMHDMLHGVWHLEKGILFTLKEVFVRPGQAALDYIKGKRIRYYNIFYLSLLLIGLSILLSHYLNGIHPKMDEIDKDSTIIMLFLEKYVKLIVFAIVPILALNALLIFRRMHLNFAEHLIVAGFILVGLIILNAVTVILNFCNYYDMPLVFGYAEVAGFFCLAFFPVWAYRNLTKDHYTIGSFLWRIVMFYVLFLSELLGFLVLIAMLLTGKGDISLTL